MTGDPDIGNQERQATLKKAQNEGNVFTDEAIMIHAVRNTVATVGGYQ